MNHLSFTATDLIHKGLGHGSMQGTCGFLLLVQTYQEIVCIGRDTHNAIDVISFEIMCE